MLSEIAFIEYNNKLGMNIFLNFKRMNKKILQSKYRNLNLIYSYCILIFKEN